MGCPPLWYFVIGIWTNFLDICICHLYNTECTPNTHWYRGLEYLLKHSQNFFTSIKFSSWTRCHPLSLPLDLWRSSWQSTPATMIMNRKGNNKDHQPEQLYRESLQSPEQYSSSAHRQSCPGSGWSRGPLHSGSLTGTASLSGKEHAL